METKEIIEQKKEEILSLTSQFIVDSIDGEYGDVDKYVTSLLELILSSDEKQDEIKSEQEKEEDDEYYEFNADYVRGLMPKKEEEKITIEDIKEFILSTIEDFAKEGKDIFSINILKDGIVSQNLKEFEVFLNELKESGFIVEKYYENKEYIYTVNILW